MRIVCISDNHDQNLSTKFGTIPEGDILVHAGDGSAVGDDIDRFIRVGKNIKKHRPGEVKLFYISQTPRRRDKVIAEVAKCDIVCANCHRIRTKNRKQFKRRKYSD